MPLLSNSENVDSSGAARQKQPLTLFRVLRKLAFYVLCMAGVTVVLYGLFCAEENWRGERQWAACRARLEKEGEKLNYEAFIPAELPAEQNFAAAPVLQAVFDANQRSNILESAPKVYLSGIGIDRHEPMRSWWKGQRVDLAAWQDYYRSSTNLVSVSQGTNAAEAVLRMLSRFDGTLAQLREYASRPKSRYYIRHNINKPFLTLLPHLSYVKQTAGVLELRVEALLALGRVDEAGRDVDLMLKLANSLQEESFLISSLVRESMLQIISQTVWSGLVDHRWTEAQLQRWQEEFSRPDLMADLIVDLRIERAAGLQAMEAMRRDPLLFVEITEMENRNDPASPAQWVWRLMPAGWWKMEQTYQALVMQDFAIAPLLQPAGQTQPVSRTLRETSELFSGQLKNSDRLQAIFKHRVIAYMLLPSLTGSFQKAARTQACSQMVSTACALERQRLRTGTYPASLEALSPDIQKNFVGRSARWEVLHYHPTPNGRFVLYSDGWNGVDDGGTMAIQKNGQPDLEQGDWVWPQPVEAAANAGK